jgi:hypothetical protein
MRFRQWRRPGLCRACTLAHRSLLLIRSDSCTQVGRLQRALETTVEGGSSSGQADDSGARPASDSAGSLKANERGAITLEEALELRAASRALQAEVEEVKARLAAVQQQQDGSSGSLGGLFLLAPRASLSEDMVEARKELTTKQVRAGSALRTCMCQALWRHT